MEKREGVAVGEANDVGHFHKFEVFHHERNEDGERDRVSCGPGKDVYEADGIDEVADDCEEIRDRPPWAWEPGTNNCI